MRPCSALKESCCSIAPDEKEVFWKRARWVDYSGAIANGKIEGITLFDHSDNPNFPTHFQVRNDGWMGASLTFDSPSQVGPGPALRLRYGLYVDYGMREEEVINAKWKFFADLNKK